MNLKPQDIVVLLKIVTLGSSSWTYASLSSSLFISPGEVHSGVERATMAKLFIMNVREPVIKALEEFIVHGIKYCFPPTHGGRTRGIPTSYAAPPLDHLITPGNDPSPVWPYAKGTYAGLAFSPLYKTVPQASLEDRRLYELLALTDAIRNGRPRESKIAIREMKKRLSRYGA